ncbi:hypothetical protein MXM41_09370 [Leclercia adecarboxylata]|uniref:hypothetical protein n=1 Tax=Leclercia adecarboxylata TaxID=83655 RepID=UPI002DB9DD1A|nr:hypothetical protein [Leclercia adecarboxylata]MEB6379144.1 hypothetical protein [Leclercia adecarboxylata]
MSTICLAAQRSYTLGEAVWFSYRLPAMRKVLTGLLVSVICLCAMLAAGVYAHLLRDLRHPAPANKPVKVVKPDVQLSDMHYVYVSKPFPTPEPTPLPALPLPAPDESPVMDNNADWQQPPDGQIQDRTLPAAHDNFHTPTLQERLLQAVKEQQLDYSQGKIPAAPEEETSDIGQEDKNSPPGMTEGDDRREFQ